MCVFIPITPYTYFIMFIINIQHGVLAEVRSSQFCYGSSNKLSKRLSKSWDLFISALPRMSSFQSSWESAAFPHPSPSH